MSTFNEFKPISRRPIPNELVAELFACLNLDKGIRLLAAMPNGLLAMNVRRILNGTRMIIISNNWAICGHKLHISGDKIEALRISRGSDPNSVRAQYPVRLFRMPKTSYIVGYFEVEILQKARSTIPIGFCDQNCLLDVNFVGNWYNSIGTWHDVCIHVQGNQIRINNSIASAGFQPDDVVGGGLVHFPANNSLKFFTTLNGQLLGSVCLPSQFLRISLFPCASMWCLGDSIRVNFGKETFRTDMARILQHFE